jgi:hypothetical protein
MAACRRIGADTGDRLRSRASAASLRYNFSPPASGASDDAGGTSPTP